MNPPQAASLPQIWANTYFTHPDFDRLSEMLLRLLKRAMRECRHVTTPEVILSLIFAAAAFAFKAFLGGGISVQDLKSIFVPLIWTVCAIACLLIYRSAREIRKEDLASWEAWVPAIPEAGSLKPAMPSGRSLAALTIAAEAFFVAVIVVTFLLGKIQPHNKRVAPCEISLIKLPRGSWSVVAFNVTEQPIDNVSITIMRSDARAGDRIDQAFSDLRNQVSIEAGTLRPQLATTVAAVPTNLIPYPDRPSRYQISIFTRYEAFTEFFWMAPRDSFFEEGADIASNKTHEWLMLGEQDAENRWNKWREQKK